MKRAFVLVTEADYVFVTEAHTDRTTQETRVEPSEQLLADLQTLVAPWNASVDVLVAARTNVRSLLPRR